MKTIRVHLTGTRQSGKTALLRALLPNAVQIEPHFAYFAHESALFQVFDVADQSSNVQPDYTFIQFNLHERSTLAGVLHQAGTCANPILIGNFWQGKRREIRQFELLTTPYTYWEIDAVNGTQVRELFLYLLDTSAELFAKQREFQLGNEVEMENELNKTYNSIRSKIALAKTDLLAYAKQQAILLKEVNQLNKMAGIQWNQTHSCNIEQLHNWMSLLDIYFAGQAEQVEQLADRIINRQKADLARLQKDYKETLNLLSRTSE